MEHAHTGAALDHVMLYVIASAGPCPSLYIAVVSSLSLTLCAWRYLVWNLLETTMDTLAEEGAAALGWL